MLTDEELKQLDLHHISDEQAQQLCGRIREHLLQTISVTGGHLASNLGTVELTVALHRVFDFNKDRLVFDVGHQCYTHKILTGRAQAMTGLRSMGGIAGFPKPSESETDAFIAGHASNSVSVALGMARARTLKQEERQVVALIGDGALTGGLAYEGLSDAGHSGEHLIIVLNDNGMSIMPNVGGVARYLARQRLKPQYLSFKVWYRKITGRTKLGRAVYRFTHNLKKAAKASLLPCSMFEDMGFSYLGPVDGHDIKQLTKMLAYARSVDGPILLHVRTVKGKGYTHAEAVPKNYHGVSAFHVESGNPLKSASRCFSDVFGQALCRLARKDARICAVTAAMQTGTGLNDFAGENPERFFDVGIAEGHAVSMCAGLAKQGMIPVFAVYSTFLQRSYDMLVHDVAIQGLHVIFCVDRAGLVGEDGETHHGLFDVAFLDSIPGMTVLAPASFAELESMLDYAVYSCTGPVAIRYPRGGQTAYQQKAAQGTSAVLRQGTDVTLVSYGPLIGHVVSAAEQLGRLGISSQIIKLNTITPLDAEPVIQSVRNTGALVVVEACSSSCSVGQRLCAALAGSGVSCKIQLLGNVDGFVPHGTVKQLEEMLQIDCDSIVRTVREVLSNG